MCDSQLSVVATQVREILLTLCSTGHSEYSNLTHGSPYHRVSEHTYLTVNVGGKYTTICYFQLIHTQNIYIYHRRQIKVRWEYRRHISKKNNSQLCLTKQLHVPVLCLV